MAVAWSNLGSSCKLRSKYLQGTKSYNVRQSQAPGTKGSSESPSSERRGQANACRQSTAGHNMIKLIVTACNRTVKAEGTYLQPGASLEIIRNRARLTPATWSVVLPLWGTRVACQDYGYAKAKSSPPWGSSRRAAAGPRANEQQMPHKEVLAKVDWSPVRERPLLGVEEGHCDQPVPRIISAFHSPEELIWELLRLLLLLLLSLLLLSFRRCCLTVPGYLQHLDMSSTAPNAVNCATRGASLLQLLKTTACPGTRQLQTRHITASHGFRQFQSRTSCISCRTLQPLWWSHIASLRVAALSLSLSQVVLGSHRAANASTSCHNLPFLAWKNQGPSGKIKMGARSKVVGTSNQKRCHSSLPCLQRETKSRVACPHSRCRCASVCASAFSTSIECPAKHLQQTSHLGIQGWPHGLVQDLTVLRHVRWSREAPPQEDRGKAVAFNKGKQASFSVAF